MGRRPHWSGGPRHRNHLEPGLTLRSCARRWSVVAGRHTDARFVGELCRRLTNVCHTSFYVMGLLIFLAEIDCLRHNLYYLRCVNSLGWTHPHSGSSTVSISQPRLIKEKTMTAIPSRLHHSAVVVNDLAEQLGITRPTVREATRKLERRGLWQESTLTTLSAKQTTNGRLKTDEPIAIP